jgi:hypothetical protein
VLTSLDCNVRPSSRFSYAGPSEMEEREVELGVGNVIINILYR